MLACGNLPRSYGRESPLLPMTSLLGRCEGTSNQSSLEGIYAFSSQWLLKLGEHDVNDSKVQMRQIRSILETNDIIHNCKTSALCM